MTFVFVVHFDIINGYCRIYVIREKFTCRFYEIYDLINKPKKKNSNLRRRIRIQQHERSVNNASAKYKHVVGIKIKHIYYI